jgi:NTP pyrophosphatase (non-canonical NTP hydrolase)
MLGIYNRGQITRTGTPIPKKDLEAKSVTGEVVTRQMTQEEIEEHFGNHALPTDSIGRAIKKPVAINFDSEEQRRRANIRYQKKEEDTEMPKNPKYPHITKQFLEAEFAAGKTALQIEREQEMPSGVIGYYVKRFGVINPNNKMQKPKETGSQEQEIERLKDDNKELQREVIEKEKEIRDLVKHTKQEPLQAITGLSLNDYQQLASRTANTDWDLISVRVIRDPRLLPLLNFALGTAGEAGEIADELKKVVFHGHKLDVDKIVKEAGDCMWYLSQLVNLLDVSLEEVGQLNIKKLKERYPEGFSEEASLSRKV